MRFSVIVPVFNGAPYLRDCLAALAGQDYSRDGYEVIVVDNNSSDGTAEILRRASGVLVLTERTQGAYAARNRALEVARGEILIFTDADCVADPGWLRAVDAGLADPRVQVVVGRRQPGRTSLALRLLTDHQAAKAERVFAAEDPGCYYGLCGNMAVRRATMEAHGPFVERGRGSDTLLVQRVVRSEGCSAAVYVPRMQVRHAEIDSTWAHYRKTFVWARGTGNLIRTMPRPRSAVPWRPRQARPDAGDPSYVALAGRALVVGEYAAWTLGTALGHLRGGRHVRPGDSVPPPPR